MLTITPEMLGNALSTDQKIQLVEVLLSTVYEDIQIVSGGNSIVIKPASKVDVLYYEED